MKPLSHHLVSCGGRADRTESVGRTFTQDCCKSVRVLIGPIEEAVASLVLAPLRFSESEKASQAINLCSTIADLSIYDTLQLINPPIVGGAIGLPARMAFLWLPV